MYMKFNCIAVVVTICMTMIGNVARAQDRRPEQPNYLVFTLPTLGGTSGAGNAINNLGWVMGDATLPGDQTQQAVVWIDRKLVKLGTLGGPNSDVPWPAVKNNKGLIVGVSDTSIVQPLGESWSCALA